MGRNFTLNKLPRLRRLALAGLLLAGGGLVGCSPLRLLKPGQRLLDDVDIQGTEKADPERLAALVQQQPNSTFPLPKVTIYQFGRSFYNPERIAGKLADTQARYARQIAEAGTDSAQVGRLLRKREQKERRYQLALDKGNAIMRLGEPPVVYDSSLTAASVQQLSVYLKSKGFFRSSVTVTDTVPTRRFTPLRLLALQSPYTADSQRVTVTYHVQEGPAFHYSQLDDEVADSLVARRVRAARPQSLLRVGDQYDEEVIGAERGRLETLLKNQGYYDFRQQYITFEADTSFRPTTVRLRTLVADPARGEHKRYTLRHVDFVSDAGIVRFGRTRDTLVRDSVNYLAYRHRISPRALDRKLALRPNEPYSLLKTQRTQRQLSSLDMFRFTTITYRRVRGPEAPADSAQGLLDATVSAAPAKKFQETTEFGGTYVAQEVGPFGNVRLKIRNVFGGAEILEFGVRAGFEGQYDITGTQGSDQKALPHELTTQLGANVNLVLPRFLVPWRMGPRLGEYNPRTRINASYTYVNRPDYTRTNAEGTFDYIWQRSAFHQYVLTPIDLSIIRTANVSARFDSILQNLLIRNGSPLFRSFDNLFIPSINATSLYNSNDFNETRDARYLRLFAEVGGLSRGLFQKQPLLTDTRDLRKSDLKVYDFAKLTADYRRYYKLTSDSYLVYRLAGGAVAALTPTKLTTIGRDGSQSTSTSFLIPYDKYLFSGGSSSVRAWKPRRLGAGSFTQYKFDPKDPTQPLIIDGRRVRDYNLEQPGELLLEGNIEYRFPLYNFIKGAVFTDFGNVWTLRSDPRPGAQFRFNQFYRQFAVGSGFGFRFDLSFLIMRLDIATKVYDPAAPGSKWAIRNFSFREDQTAFNLGIGYPF
ncbi:translocation and assembly module lipoprotein TamL [Hymenobacter actinosclerus]|uniref:Outer membrane protein assembly factor BamA n=1 Tax=Hymenobacter actinosclerus TaxID=82805 RepID=A0A1I0DT58_9BACT|nr:BamA/TamA family outer membrane protein [Hymenobacter actinosclerus]SET35401.1 Outer membrane protein assembly factor BamA [Hymenobacter actinosclerus]